MSSLVNHNRRKFHGDKALVIKDPTAEEVLLGPRHNWRFRDEKLDSKDHRPGNKITFSVFDYSGLTLNEVYCLIGK